jgi:alkylated DNA repair dioxygenase AlkB
MMSLFPESSEKILLKTIEGEPMPHSEVWYYPQFFTKEESDVFLQDLLQNIAWSHDDITIFGKKMKIPRLQAWYGDAGKAYMYSGILLQPHTWTDTLLAIKKRIEEATQTEYTSVLLNQYRDGKDSVGWHADDEPSLGKNTTIASVSLGATRKFRFRYNANNALKAETLLTHGSLVMMQGETQHYWQHEVPKTSQPTGIRINLTFRKLI